MTKYWVVGAVYETTKFDKVEEGEKEERYGPFETYEEAKAVWSEHAWSSVDTCNECYQIITEED